MSENSSTDADTKIKIKVPGMHKVVIINDDYTPMEFVTQVLIELFGKSKEEAVAVMMLIHKQGRGVAGIFTKEIAEQKAKETIFSARHYNYPLRCKVEAA